MKQEFYMSWGDPVCVRHALLETLGGGSNGYVTHPLEDMGYTPHQGTYELIERMKEMQERQSGNRPKHLFVTNGASGGLNAALYTIKQPWHQVVVTGDRYYPLIPSIIEVADLTRYGRKMYGSELKGKHIKEDFSITLTDSPSNPEGLVYPFDSVDIWDAAYASRIYGSGGHVPASYKIMVGSLSKSLGLSGLRLGWVSTDDDELADKLSTYVVGTYVGLSSLSLYTAEHVLDNLEQDSFEKRAATYIDSNREEVQKVLTHFGQGEVPTRGMFALLQLGKAERRALERANVKWQSGNSWGEDDSWARLSLGQTRETTRAAVKEILK